MQRSLCLIMMVAVFGGYGVAALHADEAPTAAEAVGQEIVAETPDAAAPVEITIESAVAIALRNNLGLRSELIELEIARRNLAGRYSVFIPELSAGATLARPHVAPENPFADLAEGLSLPGADELEDPARWALRPELQAQLTFTTSMLHRIRGTQVAYRAGLLEIEDARKQLERDVRQSFYELLLLQENLTITDRRIANAAEQYEDAEANYEAGLIDEFSLLQAQVALENLRPQRRRQQLALDTGLLAFVQSLGLARGTEVRLVGSISAAEGELPPEEYVLGFVGGNPGLRRADQTLRLLENQLALERSARHPTLTVSYAENPELAGDPLSADPLEIDNWSRGGQFALSLRVPLDPHFPRSEARTRIDNRRSERARAELEIQEAREQVELRITQLLRSLGASIEQLETLALNFELAERAYELALESYEAGLREFSDVRDAEVELEEARVAVLEEQYEYLSNLLELEYQLGISLDEIRERYDENDD